MCPGGPERSLRVKMLCGMSDEIEDEEQILGLEGEEEMELYNSAAHSFASNIDSSTSL